MTRATTSRLPETPRQVREWELAKVRYLRRGLCHKCAAQAAWGHQNGAGGWRLLHPPCPECKPFVEMLPAETVNPLWRSLEFRKRHHRKRPAQRTPRDRRVPQYPPTP